MVLRIGAYLNFTSAALLLGYFFFSADLVALAMCAANTFLGLLCQREARNELS